MPGQFSFLNHLSKKDQDEYRNLEKANLFAADKKLINARLAELTTKGREEEARQEKFGEAYASEHVADTKPVTRVPQDRGRGPSSDPEQQRITDMMYSGQNAPPRLSKEQAAARAREEAKQQQERIWEGNGGFPGIRSR